MVLLKEALTMQFLSKDDAQNVNDFNDIFDNRIDKVHDVIFSNFQSQSESRAFSGK